MRLLFSQLAIGSNPSQEPELNFNPSHCAANSSKAAFLVDGK
jgi:hypothetical protein